MTFDAAEVWATRVLEVYDSYGVGHEFMVAVSKPVQNSDNPWGWDCWFEVEGFENTGPIMVQGPDGIGALQTALNVLGAYLSRLAQTHDIRWFGSRELGFETYRLYQGPDP